LRGAKGQTRPSATARREALRERHDHIARSLDHAVAALWLLDQAQVGNLSFLPWSDDEPPAWISAPAIVGITGKHLAELVEDLCLNVIAENLGAMRAELQGRPSRSTRR
jgi:hypothetical protein